MILTVFREDNFVMENQQSSQYHLSQISDYCNQQGTLLLCAILEILPGHQPQGGPGYQLDLILSQPSLNILSEEAGCQGPYYKCVVEKESKKNEQKSQ